MIAKQQPNNRFMVIVLSSVMAVGFAWATYGPDSLSEVGFVEGVITNVFAHLADTSQLRIKSIIRMLMSHTHTHTHPHIHTHTHTHTHMRTLSVSDLACHIS